MRKQVKTHTNKILKQAKKRRTKWFFHRRVKVTGACAPVTIIKL